MTPALSAVPSRPGDRQRGVVIILCLVVLVVLLAGAAAVMRSMESSLVSAGNLAFRRDLVNQGEQAIAAVLTEFRTGTLASASATAASDTLRNYSAVQLQANPEGIPLVLLDGSTTPSGPDILGAAFAPAGPPVAGATPDVTVRYVIDRLCSGSGSAAMLGTLGCVRPTSTSEVRGGTASPSPPLPAAPAVVYRVSLRVDGPRGTQVFLQSSVTKPE